VIGALLKLFFQLAILRKSLHQGLLLLLGPTSFSYEPV
jgi:hypothetical protein